MFYRAESGLWRAAPLEGFPWLEHGFGSRHASPPQDNLATLRQIHSGAVVRAQAGGRIGEGDALVTNVAGLRLGVRTADCLPILVVDEQCRAVAAIHAGWRGTLLCIARHAVEALTLHFGSRPGSLHAAIGPGINSCCFEVGPEVAVQFRQLLPGREDLDRKIHLDLVELNRRQLVQAGLKPARIYCGAPCTCCMEEEFHSWRRDRERAGRMLSTIGITA